MGSSDERTVKGVAPTGQSGNQAPNYNYYGTFQGVPNYQPPPPPPSQPVIGFPHPAPPPNLSGHAPPQYYPHGYQTVTGYAVVEGRPYGHNRHDRLPCCGMGIGWFLFISGFFLGSIPWYIGATLLLFVRLEYREKPGLIACTLAAILALIAVMLGVTKATHAW
ncbi:hypothetical protein Leryth_008373 [Lithospermum erythrorhizon]|uniref:60S ribosomal protein L18a-like protein n=1 Tax=Lithospermum erythrorhizon TaxID=34254 RepID=A0AAV3RUQ9_LITER|nr:hypothetical protein Leryth_008373 [Lithospermum erythrorhizon]